MTHYMNLASEPFEQISSGAKTIELRLYDEKRQTVSAGDTIIFTNLAGNHQVSTKVLKLHIFDSFKELYNNLPLLKYAILSRNLILLLLMICLHITQKKSRKNIKPSVLK